MPERDSVHLGGPGEIVELRRGRQVLVRPLEAMDEPALGEAFTNLSAESRRLRFGYVDQSLSKAAMRHLVHSVDGRDHVAFVAVE